MARPWDVLVNGKVFVAALVATSVYAAALGSIYGLVVGGLLGCGISIVTLWVATGEFGRSDRDP